MPNSLKKRSRCPNGMRKNIKSGNCEPKASSKEKIKSKHESKNSSSSTQKESKKYKFKVLDKKDVSLNASIKYTENKDILECFKKIESEIIKILTRKTSKYKHEKTIFSINSPELIKMSDSAHRVRQLNMKEGDIAQAVLGNFVGWEDLGVGHTSGLDIRKKDNSVIIELKNKYNTCNSGSLKAVMDKLAVYKSKNPDTRCILGIINPKNLSKKNQSKITHNGEELEVLEGNELLDLVLTYNDHNYKNEILSLYKRTIANIDFSRILF